MASSERQMKIKALNIIKRKGNRWEYNGRFYFNRKWIPAIGVVADYKTESQIKRAIIKNIKVQAEKYKLNLQVPQEKILALDTVFKEVL